MTITRKSKKICIKHEKTNRLGSFTWSPHGISKESIQKGTLPSLNKNGLKSLNKSRARICISSLKTRL